MSAGTASAEALFERLVTDFSGDPSVTPPSPGFSRERNLRSQIPLLRTESGGGFGASGLKVDGRIFAMLARGQLVVKLPRSRVEELIASRTGVPFDPGHGRVMKEWVSIAPRHRRQWRELAQEAREFVATAAAGSRRS